MKYLFALPFTVVSLSLAQPRVRVATAAATTSTYQPPAFANVNRLEKLKAAFPIVEKLYRDRAEKAHYPGLAFGIMLDGKLVYSGGMGYADLAGKEPATPQTLFRIASMTKSVTAMAILKLRDEGRLRLDDPADAYIPELKKHRYLTADAPPISIRHLMTHSAGFPEDNPWGDRQLADTDANLLALVKGGISNANAPGMAYEYSNLGFALLGRIITVVSGQPYQQYITNAILKPLGMNDTQWEYTKVPAGRLALGYRWQESGGPDQASGGVLPASGGNWLEEPLLHDGSYGAMGGLITSIDDFSKYVALHQLAWPPRNDADGPSPLSGQPLKRSSVREMQQPWMFVGMNTQARSGGQLCPVTSGYGYGLGWSQHCTGRITVGHSGGLPGFGSQWRMLPDYGIGVIAYGNVTYAGLGGVNSAVLDTLVAIGKLQPRQLPVSPVLAQRKAEIVQLLPNFANAERSPVFAENFFADESVQTRRKAIQALYAKAGPIRRVGELKPENQLRGHFVLEGERANIDVFFTLTPETPALIQQLDFKEIPR